MMRSSSMMPRKSSLPELADTTRARSTAMVSDETDHELSVDEAILMLLGEQAA